MSQQETMTNVMPKNSEEVSTKDENKAENPTLWVFGYGSLCWHPGFDYKRALTGHIKGFTRKFWQGNTVHRGTEDKPGRVATLIEDRNGVTWGRAFEFVGDAALSYLQNRECRLGGYIIQDASFHPVGTEPPISTLVYVAIPGNKDWLGEAPLESIANEVVTSSGVAGHNIEYVLRLARFMREHIPGARDDHLFSLERMIRRRAADLKLCLIKLGGDPERTPSPPPAQSTSFQFADRLPKKKLRCVNM